jgi:hypothetical protein
MIWRGDTENGPSNPVRAPLLFAVDRPEVYGGAIIAGRDGRPARWAEVEIPLPLTVTA